MTDKENNGNKAEETSVFELLADLKEGIGEMNERLENVTDFKRVFLRGIVRGLGAAVGATIVAAIAFWLLAAVVETVDELPLIDNIVDVVPTPTAGQ